MSGVLTAFRTELARIFAQWPAFSVLVLGVVVYAALYPQPYLNEALRDVPIAIVDNDRTTGSQEFARRIAATPDVAVVAVFADFVSAEREVFARKISGVLVIPQYFERELLHGRASPVALYADASYFLMYQRIATAVTAVARSLGAEVETARLIGVGVDRNVAVAMTDPMPLTAVPLFNPQGGYATYVLPAAFILILQQTLFIGVGLLGTLAGARLRSPDGRPVGPFATVAGKLLAYLTLEAVIIPFYLVALPYLYGVPRLGSVLAIGFVAIPFVLAVGALGMVVAALLRNPLTVQLTLAAVGLPFFFLAGFAWPPEAIPKAMQWLAVPLPSTSAISSLVGVGQLGASLAEVRGDILTLWGLALVYGCLAIWLQPRDPRAAVVPA